MARKSSHPVDIYVGSRIKACRKTSGISQTELAKAVGLTFQQVQKYESGSNRVSASVLFDMSRFLGVQIGYFLTVMMCGLKRMTLGRNWTITHLHLHSREKRRQWRLRFQKLKSQPSAVKSPNWFVF
ncbi:helix-turn-helix domain-containing protein [Asticcacaulis sp. SL142]|uniref:helix-turn-helix domain-containing protein n=1 Tax=Asticcacaulis sp. SL142 TaxID=2995155 RepID=UPI003B636CD9